MLCFSYAQYVIVLNIVVVGLYVGVYEMEADCCWNNVPFYTVCTARSEPPFETTAVSGTLRKKSLMHGCLTISVDALLVGQ